VGAWGGVRERPVATTTPMAAVRAADLTLYRAKEEGRGRWTVFDPGRNARAVSRYAVSVRMPTAMERGEFFIDYQACSQAAAWVRRFGAAAPQVNVNVAGRQTRSPGLVTDVARILRTTGLDPRRLQLEITESAVVGRDDESLQTLHALVGMGVSLAIDDFGTGWSNLSYLRDLPVSGLKIAGSFVSDLNDPDRDEALGWRIVGGVVSLAHTLGLTVTAEEVETEAHAERLRAMGCDWAQGWHYGRPVRPGEISRRIAGDDWLR
jgi:EAL domain-containing protein (putative c-di-GMP-specific phosphodiesterase class I)